MTTDPPHKEVSIDKLLPLPGGVIIPLCALPNELIVLIGGNLSIEDLANARQTSKFLNQLWSPIFFRRGCTQVRSGMMGLEWAVSRNREAIVRKMLETRPDMSIIRNGAGFTPLHLAADQGMVNMTKLLLDSEADISLRSKMGDTPLHRAAKNGDLEVVRLFLDYMSSSTDPKTSILNAKDSYGNTPIMIAAQASQRPIVDFLLSQGADTTIQKEPGRTLLHTASSLGFPREIETLLTSHPDAINSLDRWGNAPLHLACASKSIDSMKVLLDAGAKTWVRSAWNETPLHIACSSSYSIDTVKPLLEAGAGVSDRNSRKETPLHIAVSRGNAKLVKLLINSGADIEAQGDNWNTPIHNVRRRGSDVLKILLEAGANVHAQTSEGRTAMMTAEELGDKEMIQLLTDAGAKSSN
ncbi:Transient receptor putative cation channel sub A member 1 [Arachnomyces sp. PD_36]|nr:Transient receptor putative cation channel sub A member 1 [Arachnomyces sp. PD_36]